MSNNDSQSEDNVYDTTAASEPPNVRQDSPVRPPVSPITPTKSFADSAAQGLEPVPFDATMPGLYPEPDSLKRPESVPLKEEDSSDAIALNAAISVLQLQKQKASKDIHTLRRVRETAIREPEAFVSDFSAGKLKHERHENDPVRATLEGDSESDEDDQLRQVRVEDSKFPRLPNPQSVFRCPPINWAKYHVAGESFDRMHENQRKHPPSNQPARDESREHHIAAPYSPFYDKLPQPAKRTS